MLLVVLSRNLSTFDKLKNFLADFGWLILLNHVATICNDMHFILALHVRHSQFSVHSFSTSKEKHFLGAEVEEALCESREPLCPIFLRGEQVCTPHVLLQSSRLVSHLLDLGRH